MADFFKEEQQEPVQNQDEAKQEEVKEPEKLSIGESEFTQEELESLVGLGQKAKEWEEKGGDTFENLKKTFGKRGERIGELKKQLEEYTQKAEQEVKEKQEKGEELSPEEQRELIKKELKEYGVVTEEDFDKYYQQRREGEKILASTRRVIRSAVKQGKPNVEEEKLLEFMRDPQNPADPQKAYNIMFEKEIDQWKADRLGAKKPAGMVTEETSTAGGKQPQIKPPKTEDELRERLKSHFFEQS